MSISLWYLLLLGTFNLFQCGEENCMKVSNNVRIEFIGETDKAPPVVIIGLKKPEGLKEEERFFLVSYNFLDSISRSCLLDEKAENHEVSILKITVKNDTDKIVYQYSSIERSRRILACLLNYSNGAEYYQLSFDIKRILKACN